MESPCRNRILKGSAACEGLTVEQYVPGVLYSLKETHTGAVLEGLQSNLRAAAVIFSGGKVGTASYCRMLKEQYELKRKLFTSLYCRKPSLASAFITSKNLLY